MLHRQVLLPPEHIYPIEDWRMVQSRFAERFLAQDETIFSIGNGYLGMRGNFEEGSPVFQGGTFVNGYYESWPIVYGEEAFGFAKTGQTMLNVTDGKIIRLYVDDEPFFLPTANLLEFERALDMRTGTLDRKLLWETATGKQVRIRSQRLVSFEYRHLAAIRYEVTVLNSDAAVVISSEIIGNPTNQNNNGDPRRGRGFDKRAMDPKTRRANDGRILLGHRTRNSKMSLGCGSDHVVETKCPMDLRGEVQEDLGRVVLSVDACAGEPIQLTKFLAYHTSRNSGPEELCERAERTLDGGLRRGFDELLAGQGRSLYAFWLRSDVEIRAGHERAQQCIRFNLFQIYQASARAEGAGVGPRGLTGQAYDGHYFWDMEMYVLPFLIYTSPRIAKNLLQFRCSHLAEARKRAGQVNQRGALYPWRTIRGEEASSYYAAGTAQYHINAAIMYAIRKYVNATGDNEFLYGAGVELLVETARLWADLGFYSDRAGGRFCIHGVTGPDEYNTVVNDNTYTNLMAREHLRYAACVVEAVRDQRPERFTSLVHDTGLDMAEIEEWRRAADAMHVPFDERLGIHPQDDSFLDKERWDFENTPAEKYPLLLHYHPLVIYRHQVIKQADIVLAMFLLGNEFSSEQKQRNFDFYDPLTTGDSSLSACIQSIVASEIGYIDRAREYFQYAALTDLADLGGNVKDGCHIASMGGTWMALVYGFAGMHDDAGEVSFRPKLPEAVERLRFPLTIHGRMLEVLLEKGAATYVLREGEGITFRHCDQEVSLTLGKPVTLPIGEPTVQ